MKFIVIGLDPKNPIIHHVQEKLLSLGKILKKISYATNPLALKRKSIRESLKTCAPRT